jgi:hypothetical protein
LKNANLFALCASLLFVFLVFDSCKKSGSGSSGPTVYAAGYWGNTRYSVAAYWVNGKLHSLTDTNHIAEGFAICADANNVYVAGNSASVTDPNSNTAMYWKNGQAVQLGQPGSSGARAIAVENGNVYVAGEDRSYPVYWQNGQEVALPGGHVSSSGVSIASSGGDVYVVGEDSLRQPCYWKNGTLIELPGVTSVATAIAVSSGNVYVAGQMSDTISQNWAAVLWTNGSPAILSADPGGAMTCSVVIDGTDVYVGGNVNTVSAVWKNGQPFSMPANTGYHLYAWGIGVAAGKVYVGGNALSIGPNWTSEAAYWSADGLVVLDKQADQSSNAWGFFVR